MGWALLGIALLLIVGLIAYVCRLWARIERLNGTVECWRLATEYWVRIAHERLNTEPPARPGCPQ